MAHNISIYCSNKDNEELLEYIESIGLNILPVGINREIETPDKIRVIYLSPYKLSDLKPYGDPPLKIAPEINPIFEMRRPYFKDGRLILGVITLGRSDFYDELKPYYMKIVRFIRKNYEKRVDSYYGKEAQFLIDEKGAVTCN